MNRHCRCEQTDRTGHVVTHLCRHDGQVRQGCRHERELVDESRHMLMSLGALESVELPSSKPREQTRSNTTTHVHSPQAHTSTPFADLPSASPHPPETGYHPNTTLGPALRSPHAHQCCGTRGTCTGDRGSPAEPTWSSAGPCLAPLGPLRRGVRLLARMRARAGGVGLGLSGGAAEGRCEGVAPDGRWCMSGKGDGQAKGLSRRREGGVAWGSSGRLENAGARQWMRRAGRARPSISLSGEVQGQPHEYAAYIMQVPRDRKRCLA